MKRAFIFLLLVFSCANAMSEYEEGLPKRNDYNSTIVSAFSIISIIIFVLIACVIVTFGMFRTESLVDCDNLQKKIDALNQEITQYESRIGTVEQEIVEQKKIVRKNMKQLEKQGAEDAKLLEDKLNQIMGNRSAIQTKDKLDKVQNDQQSTAASRKFDTDTNHSSK